MLAKCYTALTSVAVTELYKMVTESNGDASEKCRLRRHSRIRMRKLQSKVLASGRVICKSVYKSTENLQEMITDQTPAPVVAAPPEVGGIAISGRRRNMEDAIAIRTNLCSPEINLGRPIHFFAVYDGHGGHQVAALCSQRMHVLLEEEVQRVMRNYNIDLNSSSSSSSSSSSVQQPWDMVEAWKSVLRKCFIRIDEMALRTCSECGTVDYPCGCPPDYLGLSGSTAVVVVLTDEFIIVANCGDSRVVLSRRGRPMSLSFDHKPNRRDEQNRIEACGGQVVFSDAPRVQGILAMSRAIGDKYLKPYITSEPEITFTKREPEDECLILASDGMWDVVPSEMACRVARQCLREENRHGSHSFRPRVQGDDEGAIFSSRSASAAALLSQLALGRSSYDNISVIVVDLKRTHTGG